MEKIQLDGVTAGIISTKDPEDKLSIGGWSNSYKHLRNGDNVLIRTSRGQESRYTIDDITYMTTVTDQYFMKLTFNPRKFDED